MEHSAERSRAAERDGLLVVLITLWTTVVKDGKVHAAQTQTKFIFIVEKIIDRYNINQN